MPFSFEGLKFYVSINAPNRTKKAIQDNGGIVTADERKANIRITDPSRPIPSYSSGDYYSYEWVLDSVRQQRQIDETPYKIDRPVAVPPPPQPASRPQARAPEPTARSDGLIYAPANSQRRHRNAFTYEDDRILRDWVMEEARIALRRDEKFLDRGNDMYKRLEKKYPHHTFHSWRNRWLTKLALTTNIPVAKRQEPRSRPPRVEPPQEESEEEIEDVPDVQPASQASPEQPREATPEAPREEPQGQQRDNAQEAAQEEPAHDENSGRPDELFFMNYTDYYILARAYSAWKREKRESGISPKPTETFFKKLHEQHPDVSVKDFRRRYHRLRNLYTKSNATPAGSPVKATATTAASPSVNHQNDVPNGEQEEGADDNADEMEVDGLDLDDDAILNGVGDHDSAQQEFQKCLDDYNDYLTLYVPPSFYIGGRFLDTYSLWTALQDSVDDNDRIDWGAVIETLGLDRAKHPQLASQLSAWYDLNLKEFRSFWNKYKEAVEEAEEEESEDDEEAEGEGGEEEEGEEAEDEPSGSARRSTGTGFVSSILGIFGGGGSSGSTQAPESPSKHVRFSGAQAAEEEEESAQEDEEDDDDDEEDDFETRRVTRSASQQLQTPKKQKQRQTPKKAALEPETQDFAFDPETQAPLDLAGDDEIEDMEEDEENEEEDWRPLSSSKKATPARQLRTEERVVAAVPQSLPPPGSAKRKRTAAAASSTATPAKRLQRKSMA
ncbi:hypothetical protein Sste5346_009430 [Sporothrix stenoceras]|uniref:DNA-binding protein RAP1 n=1 Tax=Sporothrix stenoceras TaxID=5173 RepID=A0ABR3YJZ2_9PEZI